MEKLHFLMEVLQQYPGTEPILLQGQIREVSVEGVKRLQQYFC
ncbi:MAG: hypothetical protein Q4B28_07835 [bacterium]|nr:hypothetical protein [bacterium]